MSSSAVRVYESYGAVLRPDLKVKELEEAGLSREEAVRVAANYYSSISESPVLIREDGADRATRIAEREAFKKHPAYSYVQCLSLYRFRELIGVLGMYPTFDQFASLSPQDYDAGALNAVSVQLYAGNWVGFGGSGSGNVSQLLRKWAGRFDLPLFRKVDSSVDSFERADLVWRIAGVSRVCVDDFLSIDVQPLDRRGCQWVRHLLARHDEVTPVEYLVKVSAGLGAQQIQASQRLRVAEVRPGLRFCDPGFLLSANWRSSYALIPDTVKGGTLEFELLCQVDKAKEDRGYCYLELFKKEFALKVSLMCGPDPTCELLSTLPGYYYDVKKLADAKFSRVGPRYYHLAEDGDTQVEKLLCFSIHEGQTRVGYLRGHQASRIGASADDLGAWLAWTSGVSAVNVSPELDLLTKSAALLDAVGKRRLRMMEAVGDAFLTLMVAKECALRDLSVEEYQAARSACTNNTALSALFVKRVPSGMVVFASGVSPGVGAVGAKTLEAMLGFLSKYVSNEAAERFVSELQIMALYPGFAGG